MYRFYALRRFGRSVARRIQSVDWRSAWIPWAVAATLVMCGLTALSYDLLERTPAAIITIIGVVSLGLLVMRTVQRAVDRIEARDREEALAIDFKKLSEEGGIPVPEWVRDGVILSGNEAMLYCERVSKLFLWLRMWPVVAIGLATLAGVVVVSISRPGIDLPLIVLLVGSAVVAAKEVWEYTEWNSWHFHATTNEFKAVYSPPNWVLLVSKLPGFTTRESTKPEIPVDNLLGVVSKATLLGRIFNFGSLSLSNAGDVDNQSLSNIKHLPDFERLKLVVDFLKGLRREREVAKERMREEGLQIQRELLAEQRLLRQEQQRTNYLLARAAGGRQNGVESMPSTAAPSRTDDLETTVELPPVQP